MKKYFFISRIGACMAFLLLSWTALENIIDKLGLGEEIARKHIVQNIAGDFSEEPIGSINEESGGGENNVRLELKRFRIPNLRLLPDIIKGDKAGASRELCLYIKEYVSSAEFLAAYQRQRDAAKPVSEPPRLDATAMTALKNSVKEMEANRSKMKADKAPEAAIRQMEQAIVQMKNQIAAQSDPTPNLTQWKKLYPEDAAVAVKNRLNEYLTLAATVDFNAATTGVGKNRKFTNPAYEAKSLKWKAIYRAGKEVNDVAAAFVKQWLKEGVKTGVGSMPLKSKQIDAESAGSSAAGGETAEEKSTTAERAAGEVKKGLNKIKSKAKKIF